MLKISLYCNLIAAIWFITRFTAWSRRACSLGCPSRRSASNKPSNVLITRRCWKDNCLILGIRPVACWLSTHLNPRRCPSNSCNSSSAASSAVCRVALARFIGGIRLREVGILWLMSRPNMLEACRFLNSFAIPVGFFGDTFCIGVLFFSPWSGRFSVLVMLSNVSF